MKILPFAAIYEEKERAMRKCLVPVTSRQDFETNHIFLTYKMGELLEAGRRPNALVYFRLLNRVTLPGYSMPLNQRGEIAQYRVCGIEFLAASSLVEQNIHFAPDMGETAEDVEELLALRSALSNSPQIKTAQLQRASLPVIQDLDRWLLQKLKYFQP